MSTLGDVFGGGESVQHRAGHWDAADQTEGDCWKCTEETSCRLCHLGKHLCNGFMASAGCLKIYKMYLIDLSAVNSFSAYPGPTRCLLGLFCGDISYVIKV